MGVQSWSPKCENRQYHTLTEALPAQGKDLAELEQKYGGSYHSLVGEFLHVQQVIRFETGFAITRYAQFSSCPNVPAFHGLNRLARFLATHMHSPIMYPRQKPKGYQTIRYSSGQNQAVVDFQFTNEPCESVDADHARDTKTRKSVTCVKAFINGVIVHWIMQKQTCVAAHSTDAEVRAYFTGMQFSKYWRAILQFLGQNISNPTTIYEDNQPCISIIEAGHITKLVKHIAIPVAMITEDINKKGSRPCKIPGPINPSDIGTKPNPTSTFHRHLRFCRGQHYYPPAGSEHAILLQLHLINMRINEVEDVGPQGLINLEHYKDLNQVFDNKDQKK